MYMKSKRGRTSGQSIIETVVGIIFMIPIVLFLLDIAVLVMANTANDNLAKSAARAAASAKDTSTNAGTSKAAFSAANTAANSFAESAIITKTSGDFLTGFCWNAVGGLDNQGWPGDAPAMGNVGVVTSMTVKLPVPFPFLPSTVDFQAKAVEPVVSVVAGAELAEMQSGAAAAAFKNASAGGNAYKGATGSSSSGYNGSSANAAAASSDSTAAGDWGM